MMQWGDSHEGQQRRKGKVEGCGWKDTARFLIHTFYTNILVTDLRVTNKVTVCDQTHKSNTLPLEVPLFGSSKASKPAAPYGQRQYSVALILTRKPIN